MFEAPAGSDPGIYDLVKRVIGVPGEAISTRTEATSSSTTSSCPSRILRPAHSPRTSGG